MVYIMCMYVNKRVELAQRGIALYKMYVCIIIVTSLVHEEIKCRRAILWPPQLITLVG